MKNKGITLIALIVTIIVLLILAGVSISALTGENGIIGQAKEARINTQKSDIQEQIDVMVTKSIDKTGKVNKTNLLERLYTLPEEKGILDDTDKIYVVYPEFTFEINLNTGDITCPDIEISKEQLEEKKMEMLVTTTNKMVVLPISIEYNCIVDWGDGCTTTNEGETASKEELKIASTEEGIKVATSGKPIGISHEYGKDGEYTVKIRGEEVYAIRDCEVYESGNYYSDDNLLEITKWGEIGLKGIELYDIYKLTKIASPGENSFNNLEYCYFIGCTDLTEIPSDLFKNAPKLVESTFGASLTEIPSNLFDNTPELEYCAFGVCTGLTEIPSDLFKNTPKLLGCGFYDCTSLTEIPNNLFDNTPELEQCAFGGCTGLTEIPSDLFKNTSKLGDLWRVFADCTSLTEIPSNLFDNTPEIKNLYSAFSGCTGLTEIPSDLFKNTSKLEDLAYVFAYCTSLTKIPSNLFDNISEIKWLDGAFNGCTGLTEIPSDLFKNTSKLENLSYVFAGCTSLTGTAPEIWKLGTNSASNQYKGTPYGYDCFAGCTGLDNYDDIPEYWK